MLTKLFGRDISTTDVSTPTNQHLRVFGLTATRAVYSRWTNYCRNVFVVQFLEFSNAGMTAPTPHQLSDSSKVYVFGKVIKKLKLY
jgi:hypothetical protein